MLFRSDNQGNSSLHPFTLDFQISDFSGRVNFVPLPYIEDNYGGKAYQAKLSGGQGILGDIWDINPDRSGFSREDADILGEVEISRADRIISSTARNSFIFRHVFLRVILSQYLSVPPEKICFSYNPWGRPFVAGDREAGGIFFNMSGTEGRVLLAVSQHFQPGVDCEKINPGKKITDIARSFFHPWFVDYLNDLEPSEQEYQFYRMWVHTEACMKAIGTGLVHSSRPLFFPPGGLPIPQKYRFILAGSHPTAVFIGMDIPSKYSTAAACVFHIKGSLR